MKKKKNFLDNGPNSDILHQFTSSYNQNNNINISINIGNRFSIIKLGECENL